MAQKDIDWLNKDVLYRSEADTNYANVFDRLANIFAEGQTQFMGIDTQRKRDIEAKRLAGEAQAQNAAARGLGSSGIGKKAASGVLTEAARQEGATTAAENEIARQYGARNAISNPREDFALKQAVDSKNYSELAKIFGLLGSQGVSAGTEFSNAMVTSAAGAANRGGLKAFDYLKGWQ